MHVHDLLEHEAVRALVGRGGQDGGEIEGISQCGVGEHVVAEVVGVEVADHLRQTDLVVDYKEGLFMRKGIQLGGWRSGVQHFSCPVYSTPGQEEKVPEGSRPG